jgi:hypothetical protein
MSSTQIISDKFQELLGDKYKVLPFAQLQLDYTTAVRNCDGDNIGYYQVYNDKFTKLRQDKIIGIVTISAPTRANADFYYLTSSYSIDFSVPTNNQFRDANGNLVQEPKFTFFEDIENLIDKVINKKLTVGDKFCKLTITEPTFKGKETDGENEYAIFTISGIIVISDKANFGSDYKVELNIDGEYVELDGINTYNELLNTDGNAISKQCQIKLEQNVAQTSWVLTVSLDDVQTENKARLKLYDMVHMNIEIINSNATTEALKRKLPVRITTPSGTREFNALLSMTFGTTMNGIGSFDISFTDDNKR